MRAPTLLAEISACFGFSLTDESFLNPDVTSSIYELCALTDDQTVGALGKILAIISELSLTSPALYARHLEALQDLFALGMRQSKGEKLRDIEKINGKCMLALIQRLSPDQRATLLAWQKLVIQDFSSGDLIGFVDGRFTDELAEIYRWISRCSNA